MTSAVKIGQPAVNGFEDIYEQYVDEASFLWVLRSLALKRPDYLPADIRQLEARIEGHLDGLMTAPEQAWTACIRAMDFGDAGEVFTAAVTAFRSLDVTKIQQAVEWSASSPRLTAGLVSALSWLPGRIVHSWLKRFLTSKDFYHKRLAVEACIERREDPATYLSRMVERDDCVQVVDLYVSCLNAVGVFKRKDLQSALLTAMASPESSVRFTALRSLILLGEHDYAAGLREYVLEASAFRREAVEVVFRALPVATSREWVSVLATQPHSERLMIAAIAALGDPHAIDWLIARMQHPELARAAGEAFTLITGIDLVRYKLDIDLPEDIAEVPNDDPDDERVNISEDEYLPWPDARKIAALWQKYRSRYSSGTRYFLGKPVHEAPLADIVRQGNQRHRRAAALEIALLNPSMVWPNTNSRVEDRT